MKRRMIQLSRKADFTISISVLIQYEGGGRGEGQWSPSNFLSVFPTPTALCLTFIVITVLNRLALLGAKRLITVPM